MNVLQKLSYYMLLKKKLEGKLFRVPPHTMNCYRRRSPDDLLKFTLSNKLFTLATHIVRHRKQLLRDTKYVSVTSIHVAMLKCPALFETLVEFGKTKVNDVFF